ncbi:MAG: cytosine deaminase [Pseudomonadota bacterium]
MRIVNARLPADVAEGRGGLVDITLDGDHIAAVTPAAGTAGDLDAGGGLVLPAFVDMHTHLDKGHTRDRTPNPDGTFAGALAAITRDREAFWTADDVATRMDFSLRTAHAHGTAAIRTHIDSVGKQTAISWPVFAEMKARWANKITLQGVSLTGIDTMPDDLAPLFDTVTEHGGIVGAVLYKTPDMPQKLRAVMEMAEARDLDIDFHVDETLDPASDCLAHVAAEAARIGFSGTITCGHCCSLMAMDEVDALKTLDAVAAASIAIVSLPLCNMYLQDRHGARTPRIRGGTLVHEMAARGIRVALASDNIRDAFYAYGDLDMVEVVREATRILHLDHSPLPWLSSVNSVPAAIMGLPDRDAVAPGAPADLVVFTAKSVDDLVTRPQTDRTVIRGGKILEATPPSFDELFALTRS